MAPASGTKVQKRRRIHKARSNSTQPTLEFDIPYFAHQQLDPKKYSVDVGLPVGKPEWAPAPKEIATATNGGWSDDADAPLEDDSQAESDLQSMTLSVMKPRKPETKDANPYKRLKVVGGRPAIAKKVTADLDSDDELIVRMKNAKYLEKDIAQRLADEGRVAYNTKTIGTRWARLRKALEQRNDDMLDAELTDWHEGDDDVLREAIQKADEVVEKAKMEAENRKWRIVADQMKNLKPVVNFSQNACRSRFHDLQNGTAKPTPESITDPDEEILERIRSRREKEQRIMDDRSSVFTSATGYENVAGNAWTSKTRKSI